MQNSWKLKMIQCPSSFHFQVNQLFWWGVVAWLLPTIISTILSCLSSLSVIYFMCKPLFSTDIHLPQCTRLFIYVYIYKYYSVTTIDTFASFLWQLSTKSYLTWKFCGSSKQESSLFFFPIPPEAHLWPFIAATGGHSLGTTARRLTLESSGVMDRLPKNNNFWCAKLLEMSGQPLVSRHHTYGDVYCR